MLASAGAANAPTLQAVEQAAGAPDIRRQEGAGVALTYRLENCALLLIFTADAQQTMRLREASPSARHAGQASPSLDQCAAEASARRH